MDARRAALGMLAGLLSGPAADREVRKAGLVNRPKIRPPRGGHSMAKRRHLRQMANESRRRNRP